MNKIDYLSHFFKERHIYVFGLSHSSNMLLELYRRKVPGSLQFSKINDVTSSPDFETKS